MKVEASAFGESVSNSSKLDSALGASLGYANLPIQQLGWTGNLTYLSMKQAGVTGGAFRLDGNLAFAINPIVNFKGGLNVSKFVSGGDMTHLDPGIGFQLNVGFQITRNVGIDAGYSTLKQSGTISGVNIDTSESGPEVSLSGTF